MNRARVINRSMIEMFHSKLLWARVNILVLPQGHMILEACGKAASTVIHHIQMHFWSHSWSTLQTQYHVVIQCALFIALIFVALPQLSKCYFENV